MRTKWASPDRDFYAENGYLVMEEFLSASELEQWRAAVDEAVEQRGRQRFSFPTARDSEVSDTTEASEQQAYYDGVFTQRVNLWQTNDKVRELMIDRELGRVVTEVARIDGVRIWHDQALVKGPYANPTAFHLDVPYWSFTSADAITIWVALDDATLENGCLYYMPGSHKAKKFDNVGIGPSIGALFEYTRSGERGCSPLPGAGGRSAVPQRANLPRSRCQYDPGTQKGNDVCLHA